MMKSSSGAIIILSAMMMIIVVFYLVDEASSFAFVPIKGHQRFILSFALTMSSNSAVAERPFQKGQQQPQQQPKIPTSGVAAGFKSNRIVHCANERGLCDIDEMTDMMQGKH